ncbi:hypothetical protein GCM10025858_29720 [Alicyclobacillus sacchari]|nr:hypothetical protein GCM10025858_29720 [Alicyclobacillus sacchari]
MLTVALAKGRTAEDALPLWREAGVPLPEDMDESRALVFEVPWDGHPPLRYLLAKPDVPTYVAYGVADIGIVGKDVLLEQDKEMYELLDLGVARCRCASRGLSAIARANRAGWRPSIPNLRIDISVCLGIRSRSYRFPVPSNWQA